MRVKPKKRLGQNFLFDKNIQKKIVAALGLSPKDIVLEIGAGYGNLTRLIAESQAKVYALEIDKSLCGLLKESLKDYPNVRLLNRDILKFNLQKFFTGAKTKIKIFGNIPYYITTPIITHLLMFRDKIDMIFLTVQKEFAKRIAAGSHSKEYGSFSCFVQFYAKPEILFSISRTCFLPAPKVESSLLKLEIRKSPPVKVKDEAAFFKLIRASFNKRRKILKNSLKEIVPLHKLEAFFEGYRIDPNSRPESLTLEDFANLSNL